MHDFVDLANEVGDSLLPALSFYFLLANIVEQSLDLDLSHFSCVFLSLDLSLRKGKLLFVLDELAFKVFDLLFARFETSFDILGQVGEYLLGFLKILDLEFVPEYFSLFLLEIFLDLFLLEFESSNLFFPLELLQDEIFNQFFLVGDSYGKLPLFVLVLSGLPFESY